MTGATGLAGSAGAGQSSPACEYGYCRCCPGSTCGEAGVAEFQPKQVWLFGSHARGQADEGSDIDLLVVVGDSDEPPVRRAQRAHRCLSGLNVAADIPSMRARTPPGAVVTNCGVSNHT